MGPENSLDKDKALKSLDKLFDIFKKNKIKINYLIIFKKKYLNKLMLKLYIGSFVQ